jgi:hypothetical protein
MMVLDLALPCGLVSLYDFKVEGMDEFIGNW